MGQQYKMMTGAERLQYKGKKLPFTILNYWQLNLSVLLLNVTRGGFAEYLVLCALSSVMDDALKQVKNGMEEFDVDGPTIMLPDGPRPSRIEVKSTASVQLNTPDEKEPIRLNDSQLKFSIKEKTTECDPEKKRHSDLYVFCHYKAGRKRDNILDLDHWEFYVYPTYLIDSDPSLCRQSTISIWRLKKLGLKPHGFDTLCEAILDTQKQISDHCINRRA